MESKKSSLTITPTKSSIKKRLVTPIKISNEYLAQSD